MPRHLSTVVALAISAVMAGCQADVTTPAVDGARPSFAATESTVNQVFPLDIYLWIPCADGGIGEYVHLTGELHDQIHYTQVPNGAYTFRWHDNPQGVSGIGLTTGLKYQGAGAEHARTNAGYAKPREEVTIINNFRIIGPGPGNDYLVHDNYHATFNANGEPTGGHDNFRADCTNYVIGGWR